MQLKREGGYKSFVTVIGDVRGGFDADTVGWQCAAAAAEADTSVAQVYTLLFQ